MNGFFNVLKPPGISSGGVVAILKRMTGERVGHAGTLDPEAAGVLPIMAGKATRLFDYLVEKQKEYITELVFGTATDSQDAQGTVIATSTDRPDMNDVIAVLPRFVGTILQTPPAYSAVKRGGIPLYKLARRGEEISVESREAEIYGIRILYETKDGYMLHVSCGRGVYIRTLCHDIGAALSCPSHMRFLLRTKTGPFDISDAYTLEKLTELHENGELNSALLPLDMPLSHMPAVHVPEALRKPCENGAKLPVSLLNANLKEGTPVRLYLDGIFAGIAITGSETLSFRTMLLEK